jgi:hypothetical protein
MVYESPKTEVVSLLAVTASNGKNEWETPVDPNK